MTEADDHGHNLSLLLFGCNGAVEQDIQYSESIFYSFILLVMILLATYGNLLVILAIVRNHHLRKVRNSMLCSLAFVDLLSPIVRLLPITISTITGRWIFGCKWCLVSSAIGVFFCSASILHLCVITIERYVTIRFPLRSKIFITKFKLGVSFFLIWTLALLMGLIPYLSNDIVLYFNNRVNFCDFYLVYHPGFSILMMLIFFGLPSLLMVTVYYLIYRTVVVNNKKMSVYTIGNNSHKKEVKRRLRREWKTVKMVIVIIGVFFLLWMPYFTVSIIKSYHPGIVPAWVQRMAFACAYLNSCCNWIVYSIMNKNLRMAFIALHPNRLRKTVRGGITKSFDTMLKRRAEIRRDKKVTRKETEKSGDNGPPIVVVNNCWNASIVSDLNRTSPERFRKDSAERRSSSIDTVDNATDRESPNESDVSFTNGDLQSGDIVRESSGIPE